MHTSNFSKGGLLAVLLSLITIISWEFYLRAKGIPMASDNNDALWANKFDLFRRLSFIPFAGRSLFKEPDQNASGRKWMDVN
jgi:hypothetical protein